MSKIDTSLGGAAKKTDGIIDETVEQLKAMTSLEAEEYAFSAIKGSNKADSAMLGEI
ncbi:hypothetical protein [Listeria sp. ILCC792]|uniref:hypothetical protein n=1 Tax=Listeria sp. ILCC792 TaxID=1918331 RepID=UPI00135628D1|nr:hypothetical protein [Listeria sp. ILCC792]